MGGKTNKYLDKLKVQKSQKLSQSWDGKGQKVFKKDQERERMIYTDMEIGKYTNKKRKREKYRHRDAERCKI